MKSNLKKLSLCAIFIALGVVLSEVIPSISLPFGGSVTFFSMVPVCLIAIIFDAKWGIVSSFLYGLIQLLFGMNNLSYATWWGAAVAIILFDYVVAYTVLGFSGIFKKIIKNKALAAVLGVIFVCFLRYICHFITGVTVWREISELWAAVWYSITYNATYMIPELIITPLGVYLILKSKIFDKIKL